MKLILYRQLSKGSKKKFLRVKEGQDTFHEYRPRIDLLRRLSRDNNMTIDAIRQQLNKERAYMIESLKQARKSTNRT